MSIDEKNKIQEGSRVQKGNHTQESSTQTSEFLEDMKKFSSSEKIPFSVRIGVLREFLKSINKGTNKGTDFEDLNVAKTWGDNDETTDDLIPMDE